MVGGESTSYMHRLLLLDATTGTRGGGVRVPAPDNNTLSGFCMLGVRGRATSDSIATSQGRRDTRKEEKRRSLQEQRVVVFMQRVVFFEECTR
jgi:hypothetical protein